MDSSPSPVPSPAPHPGTPALRVALVYLVLSAAWIVITDLAVHTMVTDPAAVGRYQTWKGILFVALSAALVYALVRREVRRVEEGAARLRALADQSLAGIYLIREGRFLYVNEALARIFGYRPWEMLESMSVADVVAQEDREMVLGNLRLRERGAEESMRYRFQGVTRSGEEIAVEVHGRAVQWGGGPAVLGVLLEVGERERLERQMREAQRLRSLGELTGQIAHDFNNFLTGILGPLEICLADLPPDHPMRGDVEQARSTALSAAALSRKLLTFSQNRPSAGGAVELNQALAGMEVLLDRLVGPSVVLRVEPGEGPCVARIDASELEQVVMNLVLNAGEAVEETGTVIVRTVRVTPEPGAAALSGDGDPGSEGWIRLEVEDDGAGMEPAVQERLFEPFFTTKTQGTGLGLSTVFGITHQAGGSVEVESAPGRGSRFVVTLPASGSAPEAMTVKPVVRDDLGGREVILVVEDEDVVRDVTRRALERFGYTVHAAPDGRTAKTVAGELETLDLLLTDVRLPDSLGPDVAATVRALHPGVPVVYFSGGSDQETIRRLSRTSSTRLIHKPYVVADLLSAIRKALDDDRTAAG